MSQRDDGVRRLIDEATKLRYSRRQIFRRGAALGLGTAGIHAALAGSGHVLSPRRAAAVQETSKLNILAGSYFVPEAQDFFVQQVQDWGSQNNVEVTADFLNWPDIQGKITSSTGSGEGPDIIEMRETWTYLYYNEMLEVNDLANQVAQAGGGQFYDWVTNTVAVDGNWYSIPVGTSSAAYAYRISHLEQAGVTDAANNFPKTYEELFALGKTLKEMGKPLGQALGHSTGDPPTFAYAYMWSYGAMEVEEDGTTVAFNTPQFVEGLNLFVQAWKDAYDETGLSWDDGANNRAFLSDQISATINGSSIYIAAQNAAAGQSTTDFEVVVDPADIAHAGFPEGPAGRFNPLSSWSYGAMKYTQNPDAAKALLEWWTAPEQMQAWLEAQKGYIIPAVPAYAENPVFTSDPKLAPYLDVINYGRNKGYAGPANEKSAQVTSQYIITDTFAKAIESGDAQGAIEEGARLMERIYSR